MLGGMGQVIINTYNNHGVGNIKHLWECHGEKENHCGLPRTGWDDRDDVKPIEERINSKYLQVI